MRTTPLLAVLLALTAAGTLIACATPEASAVADGGTESAGAFLPEGALVEDQDDGSVAFHVAADGRVKALVKSPEGQLIDRDVSGELLWRGPGGETKVPLSQESTGLLVASGPPLEGDLTEVRYTLTVNAKPWKGALHLPAGGTPALAESASNAAKKGIPKGKTGPNGGVVQVVGNDLVEIVADKGTGQIRVYVLDADFKPIVVSDRSAKIGVVVDEPEIVTLAVEPGGLYFVGKLKTKVDPLKVTIAITIKGHTDVALCGYYPGTHVITGHKAPGVKILVVDASWGVVVNVKPTPAVIFVVDDDDDEHHGHGHGHGKHKHHK